MKPYSHGVAIALWYIIFYLLFIYLFLVSVLVRLEIVALSVN